MHGDSPTPGLLRRPERLMETTRSYRYLQNAGKRGYPPPVKPSPVPLVTLLLMTLSLRMTPLDFPCLAHPLTLNPEPPRHEREPRSGLTRGHFALSLAAVYLRPEGKELP